jgi:hypothetical protein
MGNSMAEKEIGNCMVEKENWIIRIQKATWTNGVKCQRHLIELYYNSNY